VIPAAFDYHAPSSVQEALRLLRSLPEAKLLAGGHSLLPMMKLRVLTPAHLIDLGRIPDLRGVREEDGALVLGAMTTHWRVQNDPLVRAKAPLLADAAASIGDPQVRNVGTIGGSLVHADPAADYPAAIVVLEAEMTVVGPAGTRAVPASAFFTGLLTSAVGPEEILTGVRVRPLPAGTGQAYLKFPHPASGFAVVGVAAAVRLRGGVCEEARIGITGVGPSAYRASAVEAALVGARLDEAAIAGAAHHAADGVEVNEDLFASADYRAHLARVFTRRAIQAALHGMGSF
jgi:carbon-monoxide dehydrogenase medium subunit